MTREKVKLVPGVPFLCTLESSEGRPMTSRFHEGTEYLYSVQHRGASCLLYLPVEGQMAMQRLGAKAGEDISIVKTQAQGQGPVFVVRRVSDATLAVPALGPRLDSNVAHAPDPNRGVLPTAQRGEENGRNVGVRMLAPRTQYAAFPRSSSEERRYDSEPIADRPLTYAEAVSQPMSSYPPVGGLAPNDGPSRVVLLSQCLMEALDAACGAELYAAKKQKAISFSEESIRAMALSIYIGKQRVGR